SLAEIWLADHVSAGPARRPGPGGTPAPEAPQRSESQPAAPPPLRLRPESEPVAKEAIPRLIEVLHDKDAKVRARAAQALSETGPLAQPAVAALTEILQMDPDRDARIHAAIALGNVGPGAKAGVPALSERLRLDEAEGVRANSAASLGMIHA